MTQGPAMMKSGEFMGIQGTINGSFAGSKSI